MSYSAASAAATNAVLEIRLKFCNCISFAYFRFMFVDANFFFVVRTFSPPSFHAIHLFTAITLCSRSVSFVWVFLLSIDFSVLSLPHNILHFLGGILLCMCAHHALIHAQQTHTNKNTNATSFWKVKFDVREARHKHFSLDLLALAEIRSIFLVLSSIFLAHTFSFSSDYRRPCFPSSFLSFFWLFHLN